MGVPPCKFHRCVGEGVGEQKLRQKIGVLFLGGPYQVHAVGIVFFVMDPVG